MTDDIVTRLHDTASYLDDIGLLGSSEVCSWAAAEITRLREQAGRAVEVKALVWVKTHVDHYRAHVAFGGRYDIYEISDGSGFRVQYSWSQANWDTQHAELDEAKAAAQADYETRVRSALVDAPAAAVVGGWKLVPPMATPKMLHAADSRFAFDQDHYAALLAAAPSPPPVEPVAPFDPVAFMQDDSGLPCRFDPPVEKGEVAVAVAAEREACAQVVRRVRDTWIKGDASSAIGNAFQRACDQALDGILGRARGEAG